LIIIGALGVLGGIIANIFEETTKYFLIPLIIGSVFVAIGLILVVIKILQIPSDQHIDAIIAKRIDDFTKDRDFSPYSFGHYIISDTEVKEAKVETVRDFYSLRGRDRKMRSSMYSLNVYYLFDRRMLVEEFTFNILNEYENNRNDVFYFQDIVKINITNMKSEEGDKQTKFVINLPMGDNFSDVISNDEDNIKKAQELVLLVNNKIEQKKLNTDNLNLLTQTVTQSFKQSELALENNKVEMIKDTNHILELDQPKNDLSDYEVEEEEVEEKEEF
jgi:hypothetical protein